MPVGPYLYCKCEECRFHAEPIRLLFPSLAETTSDLPGWPRGGWPIHILCLECGHLYAYTLQDVQWRPFPPTDLSSHPWWFRVSFRCETNNCGVQAKLYTPADVGATWEHVSGLLAAETCTGKLLCGHAISRLAKEKYSYQRVRGPLID
jgi:hypothetical protein